MSERAFENYYQSILHNFYKIRVRFYNLKIKLILSEVFTSTDCLINSTFKHCHIFFASRCSFSCSPPGHP